MTKIYWEKANKAATHWDSEFNVFCSKHGFWLSDGDFTPYKNQEEWGTSRYLARPTVWDGR